MKYSFLIAGAAALIAAAPAVAKSEKGHGHSSHAAKAKKHGKSKYYAYGSRSCPPGLAKKNNGCLPPGKWKKMYNHGQRYPSNYGQLWSYNQVPYELRSQYDLSRNYRYYYGDGYLYQVDPRTRLIQQVVNAIVR